MFYHLKSDAISVRSVVFSVIAKTQLIAFMESHARSDKEHILSYLVMNAHLIYKLKAA